MGSHFAEPPNLKKYGVPIYSVAWIPQHLIFKLRHDSSAADQTSTPPATEAEEDQPPTEVPDVGTYLVFAGGGGEGRSGIPNSILLAHFDAASNSLSDQPVGKLGTGSELPYRMALHPNGDGLICAMPSSCRWKMEASLIYSISSPNASPPSTYSTTWSVGSDRNRDKDRWFDWDKNQSSEIHKLDLKLSEKELTQLEDIGQQLALTFNNDGTALAAGGEDGNLRVFKWPSMEIILNESNAHSTVKDLHFSSDGKLLVSLGRAAPCRVWDISSAVVLTSLSNENGEVFSCCRFSQINDKTNILYIAAMTDKGGSILTWNTQTWERMSSKHVIRDTISALNVSADGKFLACGTPSGDVVIVNSTNMQIQTMVKKAHLGIVTALAFSPDSRALASVSLDSSARVTVIEERKKGGGFSFWIVIFIVLLAVAAYFLKVEVIEK